MPNPFSEQAREDLLERGYSRRRLAKIAAVFGIGAAAASAMQAFFAALAEVAAWTVARIGAQIRGGGEDRRMSREARR